MGKSKKNSNANKIGGAAAASAKSSSTNPDKGAGKNLTYSDRYIIPGLLDEIVAESPGINKTAGLYSRTDLQKTMMDTLQDLLPGIGFKEDLFWMDIRIVLCVVAIAIASFCILMLKFPKDSSSVFVCVVLYFIVAGVVGWVDVYGVGPEVFGVFFSEKNKSVKCSLSMNDWDGKVNWNYRTQSERRETTITHCVSRYFDEEGYLCIESMFNDFCKGFDEHSGCMLFQEPDSDSEDEKENKKKK